MNSVKRFSSLKNAKTLSNVVYTWVITSWLTSNVEQIFSDCLACLWTPICKQRPGNSF